ncbi:MAG: glyoxylate/hydroxypyruvate reductase A [Amylibacter sp.]|nr:glyoxylate/hydroxypyruvate reductase A [Amylibacter sp.]
MINILFSAHNELWPRYQPVLEAEFAKQSLQVNLFKETNFPETIDYLIYAPTRVDDDLTVFTNLKLIQSLWAGPDKLLKNPTLTQPMARMVDAGMTQGMMDYVFGHIMRHHLQTDKFFHADKWLTDVTLPLPSERVVAFLGIGQLGMACAIAAQEYGFNVIGWSRKLKRDARITCFAGEYQLRDVLGQADIVVTLMPATPATEKIIGADAIAAMKNGAALINPGRGELIDDDALLAGLRSGKLSGATLDVFREEPLPLDHPYWIEPNVLVTPHIASETRVATASKVVAENIARDLRGEGALFLVDPILKY